MAGGEFSRGSLCPPALSIPTPGRWGPPAPLLIGFATRRARCFQARSRWHEKTPQNIRNRLYRWRRPVLNTALTKRRHAVESFAACMHSLPPEQRAPASWGPRAVLVPLVFWHKTFVSAIHALLEPREPSLTQGTFAELNTAAVPANTYRPQISSSSRAFLSGAAQGPAVRPAGRPVWPEKGAAGPGSLRPATRTGGVRTARRGPGPPPVRTPRSESPAPPAPPARSGPDG